MNKSFKKSIQEHYSKIELNSVQLNALNNLQNTHKDNNVKQSNSTVRLYALFASITLTIVLIFTMQFQSNHNQLIAQISDEVAKNHLKLKPLEVVTTEIAEVQSYFTKLEFLPISSTQFTQNNQAILKGGRYCSIKGSTAAQIRYQDNNGSYVTLFQTNYNTVFRSLPNIDNGEQAIKTFARGVEIVIWVEKGLVMVTAKN